MSWWLWCIIGFVGMGAELVIPTGFYLFLLGVAGVLTGGIVATGVLQGWPTQAVVFTVLSVVHCLIFVKPLRGLLRGSKKQQDDTVGQRVKVLAHLAAGATGSGELWGSTWRIRNVDSRDLAADSEAIVVAAEGVTLQVKRAE